MFDTDKIKRIWPTTGSMLGGFPVAVYGPCSTSGRILCRFNKTVSKGVITKKKDKRKNYVICVTPMFARVGTVPLSVSVDGGVTYTPAVDFVLGMYER